MMKSQLLGMIRASTTTERSRDIANRMLALAYDLDASLTERRDAIPSPTPKQ